MQFKAGYIIDSIAEVITEFKKGLDRQKPADQTKFDQINGLLQYVSSFEVEFPYPYQHDPDYKNLNPVLATLNNIITRGLPTKAPLFIEEKIVEFGLVEPNKEEYEFDFSNAKNKIPFQTIFELLHILEPGLEIPEVNYAGSPGSKSEWLFLHKMLKDYPFAKQILQSQRKFETINHDLGGGRSVDFSYEFPYLNAQNSDLKKKGVIFEYDGQQHNLNSYKYYDTYRDDAAAKEDFETLRQPSEKLELDASITCQFKNEIFKIFGKNYKREIKEYFYEYSLIFIPLAVSRIQKTLLEYFLRYPEIFKNKRIRLAIIERDLPCGAIAIESLKDLFKNLNAILEEKDQLILPEIELTIFENKKWLLDERLHLNVQKGDKVFFRDNDFDIVIDHSILRRSNIFKENDFKSDQAIKIRSSHYFDTSFRNTRRVYCADLLHYKELLVGRKDDGSYEPIKEYEPNINFFIQNIFRKKKFREGQLPIISRALRQKPVIGLLPTGGGKSLTFQLSAFLQPGLCLVVDPIKSLMEDQVRVLRENWIDCCDFINSNLKREEKKQKLIDFRYGETMFLFISPERFVMEDFREIIKNIDNFPFGLAFSYCVIDEVHCVSEWGHDFRSTYLMLGKNSQLFSKTRNGKVTLIGLTATASFDVLADVERELQIQHEDIANAVIMIENTIRPELFFHAIDVTDKMRMEVFVQDFLNLGNNLDKLNNENILRESEKHHFDEFEKRDFAADETKYLPDESMMFFKYNPEFLIKKNLKGTDVDSYSTIIFCPTKVRDYGVDDVYKNLKSEKKGFFYATQDGFFGEIIQRNFNDFLSGKIKHMVCTKAFGMGIDKKDVRATYHYNYPGSLESFVQECGRAGRDQKIAEANILVSKAKVFRLSFECLLKEKKEENDFTPIKDTFHRVQIRRICEKGYNSEAELKSALLNKIRSLKKWVGGIQLPLSEVEQISLYEHCLKFIEEDYADREVHNFFYTISFKGIDTEVSQFHSLFKEKEFTITSKLKEINEKYNAEFGKDYSFDYWKKETKKRLYIKTTDGEEEIGDIDLSLPLKIPKEPELNEILQFLKKENNRQDDIYKLCESEDVVNDTLNDGSLKEKFEKCEDETFNFYITAQKIYPENLKTIYLKLSEIKSQSKTQANFIKTIDDIIGKAASFSDVVVKRSGNPGEQYLSFFFNWFTLHEKFDSKYVERLKDAFNVKIDSPSLIALIYQIQIERSFEKSKGSFTNFLLLLEENIQELNFTFDPENKKIKKYLKLYYNRSRKDKNDTGRLIYRMHCMGFLTDYTIDYNKNSLYKCTFRKYNSIEPYIEHIEEYFRRYLSENSALEKIKELEKRLTKTTLIDNILECLYFLSGFYYDEIANKRKRATDEIVDLMNKSITDVRYAESEKWFEQNKFIKEEIYFYFNAKYARIEFKIKGEPYSLLADFSNDKNDKIEILEKYLGDDKKEGVFKLEGTEQNNYKHMIGSCKKILRSLSENDFNQDWLLRLLKAFAMYSVNNPSYTLEANDELEKGFDNLCEFYKNDLGIIRSVFETYFNKLQENIQKENPSFTDIKTIRMKLLLKLQINGVNNILNNFQPN